jgi:hypothetical protein
MKRVTAALDGAGIRYAVIGGNAVAAVGRPRRSQRHPCDQGSRPAGPQVRPGCDQRDPGELGFQREDVRRLVHFLDPQEPSRRSGVRLVWADELVRPSYVCPAPAVEEGSVIPEGFWVLALSARVRMKLTSFRATSIASTGRHAQGGAHRREASSRVARRTEAAAQRDRAVAGGMSEGGPHSAAGATKNAGVALAGSEWRARTSNDIRGPHSGPYGLARRKQGVWS